MSLALKAGEESVQVHVTNEQRKLSCVAAVMAEHKKKQSKTFKFKLPDSPEVQYILHVHTCI